MKTTVDRKDETTVELTVEVEPERVQRAFDAAARELAKQVNIKGFRPGKAPRRLIEQRFGKGALAQQALEPAINEYYVEAMEEADLDPVAFPEIDPESITFSEDEGCSFTATIPVRPEFEAPEHEGIQVPFPIWDVDDDQVDEELAQLRDRFAEVDVVERAAAEGDYVTLDLTFAVAGEEQEEQAVEDAMYEVGSQGVTPKLDEQLVGASAGDELTYTDVLPEEFPEHGGEEAEFTVTVKDVRAKTLPALDDDFALTASEFDTIDELRESIREQHLRRSILRAQHEARSRVLEAYLALADIELPEPMVDNEVEARVSRVEQQAEMYDLDVDTIYEAEGTTAQEYEQTARTQATGAVKAQLVLDQLANQLDLEVTDEDVNEEIVRHAQQNNVSPAQIAQVIQQQGSIGALVGDVLRRKAIDAIVEAATLEGAPDQQLLVQLGLAEDPDAEVPADAQALVDEAVAQADVDVAAVAAEVDELARSDDAAAPDDTDDAPADEADDVPDDEHEVDESDVEPNDTHDA